MHHLYFHLMRLFRHKLQAGVVKRLMGRHRISQQAVSDSSIHFSCGSNKVGFLRQRLMSSSNPDGNVLGIRGIQLYWILLNPLSVLVLLYFLSTSMLITAFCQTGELTSTLFDRERTDFPRGWLPRSCSRLESEALGAFSLAFFILFFLIGTKQSSISRQNLIVWPPSFLRYLLQPP